MRDAFGGVFMIRLFLVFIFIFVAFSAISLNYAKAFRVKNKVIDFVEQNEIINLSQLNDEKTQDKLKSILATAGYTKTCNSENIEKNDADEIISYCIGGVTIKKNATNNKTIQYTVITSASWDLGVLNKLLALAGKNPNSETPLYGSWTISGEAIVIDKYNK